MVVTFHGQVFIHNAYILKMEKILWVAIKDNFLRIVIKNVIPESLCLSEKCKSFLQNISKATETHIVITIFCMMILITKMASLSLCQVDVTLLLFPIILFIW